MKFGPHPVSQAEGATLAYSLNVGGVKLRKGQSLTKSDIVSLANAGVTEVTVAIGDKDGLSDQDITEMGVGGPLKEIPTRPQPRGGRLPDRLRPRTEIILLAAGGSNRMRGSDKLLQVVDGEPLLRHTTKASLLAKVERVHVVMQPENIGRDKAIAGLDVNRIASPQWQEGMAASIRAGISALSKDCNAVIIALADMPEVTADHYEKLIAAFDATQSHEICRAMAADGSVGLPVLFGRRFFEALANLQGNLGARDIVKNSSDFLVDVTTPGQGAVIDLDSPEDWELWRKGRHEV